MKSLQLSMRLDICCKVCESRLQWRGIRISWNGTKEKGGGNIGNKKKQKHRLHKELKAYAKAGMKLWLNGEPSTPSDIMHQCMICEEGEYMRDFVCEDDKSIIGIGFDHVKIK